MKIIQFAPENAEAWYDLAAAQAVQKNNSQALRSLDRALQLSTKRLAKQPEAKDLKVIAAQDARFKALRQMPEYERIMDRK